MRRPTLRDLAMWAALVVIAVLVILDTPRMTFEWNASGDLVLTGVLAMVVTVVRGRRSGRSWWHSIGRSILNGFVIAVLGGAFIVLSMNFGKVPADPFDIPIDTIGWLLLAIAVVFVWVAVARVIEVGPFRPKPIAR